MSVASDDVSGLAAEMAYRLLFAVFPFLIFLTAILGFIGPRIGVANLFETVMGLISQLAPPEVQQVIGDWVASVLSTQSPGLLTLGALGAWWGAAGGVGTLMKGLNRAYRVKENRPFWGAQTLALLATVVLAFVMIGGAALFTIGEWLEGVLGQRGSFVGLLLSQGQGVTVALGLLLILMLVYTRLPNAAVPLREAIPGAVFATAAWTVLTLGFSFYVSRFGSYDATFGSLGAAVVLMVWMYAVALILLIGGEINAVLRRMRYKA
jgi:membrane protein